MNNNTLHQLQKISCLLALLPIGITWSSPPDEPGNLRPQRYSATAGEIFWDRAADTDGLVIGYDVTRNGESLGVIDALSLFQNDLNPEASYTYELTAVDNEGERSTQVTTVLHTRGGGSTGSTPATPQVNFAVYSRTAAELFWDRAADEDGLVIGYEIVRDGKILGTFDALSLFVDDLQPGESYLFTVRAIDNDGNRSDSYAIEFSTDDAETQGPSTPSPGPPANLTARIYSATAAELFWDRADIPGMSYKISRLGLSQTDNDGTSFFDDTLIPGIFSYTFEVVALNPAGLQSEPTSITIDTSAFALGSENSLALGITVSNYLEVLSTVLDVFNGSASDYGQAILDAPAFSDKRYVGPPTIVMPDPEGPPVTGPPEAVICSNGGTVIFTPFESGLNEITRGWDADFDNCQDDATLFNGQFRRLTDFSQRRDSTGSFVLITPEHSTQFSGSLEWKFAIARGDSFSRYWRMDDLEYRIQEGEQVLFELSDANTFLSIARPFSRRLNGGFSLFWKLSDGTRINITVLGDMEQDITDRDEATFDGVSRYDTGLLQITAEDGSALVLDAANGDPDSAQIRLTTNGTTESFTQDWSFLAPLQLHPLRRPYEF